MLLNKSHAQKKKKKKKKSASQNEKYWRNFWEQKVNANDH